MIVLIGIGLFFWGLFSLGGWPAVAILVGFVFLCGCTD